jgi:hypothetical protein
MKFISGVVVGVGLVLGAQWLLIWEVRVSPPNRGVPPLKIKAEVKEPQLYELMLLMKSEERR